MNQLSIISGYISGEGHNVTALYIIGGIAVYALFIAAACMICGANGKNPGE